MRRLAQENRLREFADRLEASEGLLAGVDFDGTLAPIASDPSVPTITPACRRALRSLVENPRSRAAVISGRSLADLRDRVGLTDVDYVGNHGFEVTWNDHVVVHPVAAETRPVIREVLDHIDERLRDVPGLVLEDKGATATVHLRQVPDRHIPLVQDVVESTVHDAAERVTVTPGKKVLELRPDVEWNKGTAVENLREATPDQWLTVYIGDDTTDEDAFQAIKPEGIGVHIGNRNDTAAEYRLKSQTQVAPLLTFLANRTCPKRSEVPTH